MKVISLALASLFSFLPLVHAQTLKVIHSFAPAPYTGDGFTNSEGAHPCGALVVNGNVLIGTTQVGGLGMGTVFSVNLDGSGYTVLHVFAGGLDGSAPYSGLVASGNSLFGTTSAGAGTVYTINADGSGYQVLHEFSANLDGGGPVAELTLSGDVLYGSTPNGLFSMNIDGSDFKWIYSFSAMSYNPALKLYTNGDGSSCMGSLAISGNLLYGTTYQGGPGGCGTVFAVDTDGANFTVLHFFTGGVDASNPWCGLLLDGNTLYGATCYGGTNNAGALFSLALDGGHYTLLHDFGSDGDGANPKGNLIARNGTLYGSTLNGGSNGVGTVFSVRTNGQSYSVIHSLDGDNEGQAPVAGLTLAANTLYGAASYGGTNQTGSIFSVALPGALIANFGFHGTSLAVNAANGVPGANYTVIASASLLAPLSQWTPIATGAFDASGNSNLIVTNAVPPGATLAFFKLRLPQASLTVQRGMPFLVAWNFCQTPRATRRSALQDCAFTAHPSAKYATKELLAMSWVVQEHRAIGAVMMRTLQRLLKPKNPHPVPLTAAFSGIGTLLLSNASLHGHIDEIDPLAFATKINEIFTPQIECLHQCGGLVVRAIGDATLAAWGLASLIPSHADLALACGQRILSQRKSSIGAFPLRLRITLATGKMSVAVVGGQFQVYGLPMTVADRMQQLLGAQRSQLLFTSETKACLSQPVSARSVGFVSALPRADIEVFESTLEV